MDASSSDSSSLEVAAYSRQQCLVDFDDELFKKQVCMIIGSGGVGSCTGLTLARLGVKHISFFDMDVVEASNLNRQLLFSADQVGTMKATACKESVEKLHSFRTSASAINGDAVIEWKNVVAEAKRTSATAIFNGCDYGGFHDAAIQSLARALGCPYTAASTYAYTYMVDSFGGGAKDTCCVCTMPPTHPLCFDDFNPAASGPASATAMPAPGKQAAITEDEVLAVLLATYRSKHPLLPGIVSRAFCLTRAELAAKRSADEVGLPRSSASVLVLRSHLGAEILDLLRPELILSYDSLGFIPKDPTPPTKTIGSWVVVCAMGSMFAVNSWVQRLSGQDVPEMSLAYLNARTGPDWRESMMWENIKCHNSPRDGCPLCGYTEEKPDAPSPKELAERAARAEAQASTARWTGMAVASAAVLAGFVWTRLA